ncbi:hypothetical protein OCU04_002404 [Sclerotinia nivalis]|uniref:Uncharacterized protein n=1 Tax=Sclerotinia nivalis TaxID=352851 RepID=A0A9X0ATR2_9HELO|nr:hypothetical protein OCU04_002404 [Sclerotinia nivalis]
MNDNDKELVKGVLSQNDKIDFKLLKKFLKPELEPDEITRTMIESTRLRWKGLKERHGIVNPPPATPDASPKKPPKKEGVEAERERHTSKTIPPNCRARAKRKTKDRQRQLGSWRGVIKWTMRLRMQCLCMSTMMRLEAHCGLLGLRLCRAERGADLVIGG